MKESSMANDISIKPAHGTWVVRAGGAVLGESENAMEVTLDGVATIYFPKGDIATEFLDETGKTETTPLGDAAFFSIVTKSTTLTASAWCIEAPASMAAAIARHLAFATSDLVAVEKL
jgi:uncharacterized protein (DUF427 family)